MILVPDIFNIIFGLMTLEDKLHFRATSKEFKKDYQILNISIHDPSVNRKIKDNFFQFHPDIYAITAGQTNNSGNIDSDKINNCGINDISLKYITNLRALHVCKNVNVTNVNHLKKLEILDAQYNCGIDDVGISELVDLKCLWTGQNKRITNVNHMTKLEKLHAYLESGIGNAGISELVNLTTLCATWNEKITNINHLTNLQILNACEWSGIDDIGLSKLTNIITLDIRNNNKITNINHMINLTKLDVSNRVDAYHDRTRCGIDTMGLIKLTNLIELDISNNDKITNINHMTNLRILRARGNCGIINIDKLVNLTELDITSSVKIINIAHLVNLQVLNGSIKG
jgi:hypothetical protein